MWHNKGIIFCSKNIFNWIGVEYPQETFYLYVKIKPMAKIDLWREKKEKSRNKRRKSRYLFRKKKKITQKDGKLLHVEIGHMYKYVEI